MNKVKVETGDNDCFAYRKLERDIASDIWGLRGIIKLLLNFIKL